MDRTNEAILNIWQPLSARPLNEADAREIAGNLCGFFEVLNAWRVADEAEAGFCGRTQSGAR